MACLVNEISQCRSGEVLKYDYRLPLYQRARQLHTESRNDGNLSVERLESLLRPREKCDAKRFMAASIIQHLPDADRRDSLWKNLLENSDSSLKLKKAAVRHLCHFSSNPQVLVDLFKECEKSLEVCGSSPSLTYVANLLRKNGKGNYVDLYMHNARIPPGQRCALIPFCTDEEAVGRHIDHLSSSMKDNDRLWCKVLKWHRGNQSLIEKLFVSGLNGRERFFSDLLSTLSKPAPTLCSQILVKLWSLDEKFPLPWRLAQVAPSLVATTLIKCGQRKFENTEYKCLSKVPSELMPLLIDRVDPKTPTYLLKPLMENCDEQTRRLWWRKNGTMIWQYNKWTTIMELDMPKDIRETEARKILIRSDIAKHEDVMFACFTALPHEDALENFKRFLHDADISIRVKAHTNLAVHFERFPQHFDEYLTILSQCEREPCPVRTAIWAGLSKQRPDLLVSLAERKKIVYALFQAALKSMDHNVTLAWHMTEIAMRMFDLTGELKACHLIKASQYGNTYSVCLASKCLKRLVKDPEKLRQLLNVGGVLKGDITPALPQALIHLERIHPVLSEILDHNLHGDINRHRLIEHLLQFNPARAAPFITMSYLRENPTVWRSKEIVSYIARTNPSMLDIYLNELEGGILTYKPKGFGALPLNNRILGNFSDAQLTKYSALITEDLLLEADNLVAYLQNLVIHIRSRACDRQETKLVRTMFLPDMERCQHYVGLPIQIDFRRMAFAQSFRKVPYIRKLLLAFLARSCCIVDLSSFLKEIDQPEAQIGLDRDPLQQEHSPLPLIYALHSFVPRFAREKTFSREVEKLATEYLQHALPHLTTAEEAKHAKVVAASDGTLEVPANREVPATNECGAAKLNHSEDDIGDPIELLRKSNEFAFKLRLYRAIAVLSLCDKVPSLSNTVQITLMKEYEPLQLTRRLRCAILIRAARRSNDAFSLEFVKLGLRKEEYYTCVSVVKRLDIEKLAHSDLKEIIKIALSRDADFSRIDSSYDIKKEVFSLSSILLQQLVSSNKPFEMNRGDLGVAVYETLKRIRDPIRCIQGAIDRRFRDYHTLSHFLYCLAVEKSDFSEFRWALHRLREQNLDRQSLTTISLELYDNLKQAPHTFVLRTFVVLLLAPRGALRIDRVEKLLQENNKAALFIAEGAERIEDEQDYTDLIDHFIDHRSHLQPQAYLAWHLFQSQRQILWNRQNLARLKSLRNRPTSSLVRSLARQFRCPVES